MRRGIYGREGVCGHLHPSVAERKTWEYKRRKPADAGFLLIVGLLVVRPTLWSKIMIINAEIKGQLGFC